MKIQENISLKPYNTFGIDKNARFFAVARTTNDMIQALKFSESQNIPAIILGGGSNILLTQNQNALIIKNEIEGIQVLSESENEVLIEVGGGENWHKWVLYSIDKGWSGIENLSLIPGTVGASPMQNIGAYGVEIKDVFHSLKALNRETLSLEEFDSHACNFGYRESVFKNKLKGKYIICHVTFRLSKTPHFKTDYGAIRETLKSKGIEQLTSKAISDAVIEIRQSKLPDPAEIGNSGSFFKNPTVSESQYQKLKEEYPEIPGYPNEYGVKLAAGWLIEKCGWKGYTEGHIGVHKKQALVLVNYGGGEGAQVASLAKKIKKSVWDKFQVEITPEVNYL